MQTFLTSPSFAESAAALDNKRLGKQRVETLQIMKALLLPDYGWKNHPAVRMWRGYEAALLDYQYFVVHEWKDIRGYKDTCLEKTCQVYDAYGPNSYAQDDPPWMRYVEFHESHQSNLIRKDPFYYGSQFPGIPDNLEYVWPV